MYGRDAWQPGDVWIMNDSYLAGTHLNDITVYGPIFHDEQLVGFAASRAHWLDVGAKDAGAPMDSTELESWGEPGPGKWLTIYANEGHVFMYVAGLRFDTSGRAGDHSSRWQLAPRTADGFVARHYPGL